MRLPVRTHYIGNVGENITLQCPLRPGVHRSSYTVEWRNSSHYMVTEAHTRYKVNNEDFSLHITNLILDDEGDLEWIVRVHNPLTNEDWPTQKERVELFVQGTTDKC